jgi:hypothetical protein
VLTSGMETTLPDYPLDEHGHEIYARRVNVSYNREDSCFQKPAQPYIMSHSILVQLDNTGFNTGFGYLVEQLSNIKNTVNIYYLFVLLGFKVQSFVFLVLILLVFLQK